MNKLKYQHLQLAGTQTEIILIKIRKLSILGFIDQNNNIKYLGGKSNPKLDKAASGTKYQEKTVKRYSKSAWKKFVYNFIVEYTRIKA